MELDKDDMPLIYLFIQLFIYISMEWCIFILFWVMYLLGCIFVINCSYVPLTCYHPFLVYFLSTSLISGTIRCPRLVLYFICPNPRISHISMKLWFHLLTNRILKAKSGCCICILIAIGILLLPANRTRSYMCIYTKACCAVLSLSVISDSLRPHGL